MNEVALPELPKGWIWTTLGEIRDDKSKAIVPNKMPNQYFELYSVTNFDIKKPEIILGGAIGSNKQIVDEGTVLLCKINPRINRVWVVDNFSPHIKIASTEWIPFFEQKEIDPKYLCYFMENQDFRSFISLNVSGVGGSLMRIRPSTISQFPFPLPPLPEQHRIVSKIEELFTELDAGVESLKKVRAQLKAIRQSVLKHAFEGKLTEEWRKAHKDELEHASMLLECIREERKKIAGKKYKELPPLDTSELPELPEGWGWSIANNISSRITDGEHITPKRTKNGILLLSARNILDGKLSFHEVDYISESEYRRISKRLSIESGDVLLSCSGTVGRSCVVPENIKFSLVRSVAVIKLFFNMGQYISLVVRSPLLQSQINEKKTQTAQSNIFQGKIKALIFPIAPILEQHQIVSEIERRFSVIDEMEKIVGQGLKQAERLRQSVLKKAFEGRLVPQDPTDESAERLLERIREEKRKKENKQKGKRVRYERKGLVDYS